MKTTTANILHTVLISLLLTASSIHAQTALSQNLPASAFSTLNYPALTVHEGKDLTIPLPPAEHPRLFFRKKDLPLLLEKTHSPLLKTSWQTILQNAGLPIDGTMAAGDGKQNLDLKVINALEAKAFLYVATSNAKYGKDAVTGIMNLHRTVQLDPQKQDVTRDFGRIILTTAIVYDWCYDLLSVEDKRFLIGRIEYLGSKMEIEWPLMVQSSVTGHGVEAQLFRDMLAAGIATYDEQPQMYRRVAGRLLAEFFPASAFYHTGSYHHQGSSYGSYRFGWEVISTLIFDRMGYPNVADRAQASVPYRWVYLRRPDGQLLRDGDDFAEIFTGFGKYWDQSSTAYVASFYADPILMNESLKHQALGKDALFNFLLFNPLPDTPSTQSASIDTLPLTRYFDAPLGSMIARTGWTEGLDSDSVVAEMKIGVINFANHQHMDAGGFQIYYKGPLAVQSGVYQGANGGYGSEHFINYYQRTIAHNSLLVFDPKEQFTWTGKAISNDGGQPYVNGGNESRSLADIQSGRFKRAEVLAHDFGPDAIKPDYSYIKGELAPAYGNKVSSVQRSFVFLNLHNASVPAALIVFDRISASNPAFKKTWLLHSVEKPTVVGNISTIQRQQKGYNGQLVNVTLLPTANNLTIEKIGGSGHEYEVGGKNYPQMITTTDNSADGTSWRLEISPKQAAATDQFLNVMQVMDADGKNKALAVEKFETNDFVGTKLGDRLVLFSKTGATIAHAFNIKINSDVPLKVLIVDIGKGKWTVQNKATQAAVGSLNDGSKEDKNLLYFSAAAGEYLIQPK